MIMLTHMEYLVPVIIALTTSVFGPILVEWVKKRIINTISTTFCKNSGKLFVI